jgi:hypothetical protein
VRVVFVQYGFGNVGLAAMMVESCLKLGYEVWQLSDEKAPRVSGIDRLIREPMKEGRMLYRARVLSQIEAPYVMLDTDMIVARDISDGFGGDAAVTWRAKHNVWVDGEPKPIKMPYNGGVLFVQNQDFMKACYEEMLRQPAKFQDWYGDQIALRDVVDSGKFEIKKLTDPVWNFVPDSAGHDTLGVRIYHYKGIRKEWMPARFKQMFKRHE